jgi:hypothetical protein
VSGLLDQRHRLCESAADVLAALASTLGYPLNARRALSPAPFVEFIHFVAAPNLRIISE